MRDAVVGTVNEEHRCSQMLEMVRQARDCIEKLAAPSQCCSVLAQWISVRLFEDVDIVREEYGIESTVKPDGGKGAGEESHHEQARVAGSKWELGG